MFLKINLYSFWLVSLCATLIIGIAGCGADDDNEWVGTWTLDTVDGVSVDAQFEIIEQFAKAFGEEIEISYTEEWTFDADGMWHRESTLVAPNDDGIAETTSFETTGTYSLSNSNYTRNITSVSGYDVSSFDTVEGIDIDEDFSDSGTWLINGNTLTLTSDAGQVFSLKKK